MKNFKTNIHFDRSFKKFTFTQKNIKNSKKINTKSK